MHFSAHVVLILLMGFNNRLNVRSRHRAVADKVSLSSQGPQVPNYMTIVVILCSISLQFRVQLGPGKSETGKPEDSEYKKLLLLLSFLKYWKNRHLNWMLPERKRSETLGAPLFPFALLEWEKLTVYNCLQTAGFKGSRYGDKEGSALPTDSAGRRNEETSILELTVVSMNSKN